MLILSDAAATEAAGRALAAVLRAGDVVTLAGDLGAGKTSLARGVLAGLGLADDAPSPTFPIVIAYAPPDVRLAVAHVDLYRIDDPAMLGELGLDELAEDGALIVEWPARAGGALPGSPLALALEVLADGARRLTWQVPEAWRGRWPPR